MDHFLHPRNVGEIADADAVAEVGNISCGDALKLFLKLDQQGRICEAKFQTFGCASAIASSSVLTELIIGMTLDEASRVTNNDIVKALGELPEAKIHCSVMGMEALQAAIANYYGKTDGNDHKEEGNIVCHCFGVTDERIKRAAKEYNLKEAEEVKNYIKAGGACGLCLDKIQMILNDVWAETPDINPEKCEAKAPTMNPVQKIMLIQSLIAEHVKPVLQRDGGDIEFINLNGNNVQVKLKGACSGCPGAKMTLKNVVEAFLKQHVSNDLVVEEVQ